MAINPEKKAQMQSVKSAFVENVYSVIKHLEALRGENGERFHVFVSTSNFEKPNDKRNLSRNLTPTINVGIIYAKDLPDSVAKDQCKYNAQEVVKRYASEHHKDFVQLYSLKAALGINIAPDEIKVTRYDNRCAALMEYLPEMQRKWQTQSIPSDEMGSRLRDAFSYFVSSKNALESDDINAFNALITRPQKLTMREKIGLWQRFG